MALEHMIVVDWGTTNFRAWRFDAAGTIAATHQAAAGIMSVAGGAFEDALEREIGPWLAPGVTVLLSGMITSRNGWRETPYVEAPATLGDLRSGALTFTARSGANLHFLPGVCTKSPPDVMRGEEIQVFGAVGDAESATIILPGTHSKWVRVENGRLAAFRTFFTGEMFALLTQHSIIGKVPGEGEARPGSFTGGVENAKVAPCGLLNAIFHQRAAALLGAIPAPDIPERLSGLLIGHEIVSALPMVRPGETIRLVGDSRLCDRYAAALAIFGVIAERGPEHATVEGFRKLTGLNAA